MNQDAVKQLGKELQQSSTDALQVLTNLIDNPDKEIAKAAYQQLVTYGWSNRNEAVKQAAVTTTFEKAYLKENVISSGQFAVDVSKNADVLGYHAVRYMLLAKAMGEDHPEDYDFFVATVGMSYLKDHPEHAEDDDVVHKITTYAFIDLHNKYQIDGAYFLNYGTTVNAVVNGINHDDPAFLENVATVLGVFNQAPMYDFEKDLSCGLIDEVKKYISDLANKDIIQAGRLQSALNLERPARPS